jgi:D-glycero-D-manno-heptose 1,7-bisphosphate phosphatase
LKPAVFLDRDGTIIEDVGYLSRARDIAFFPWTADAIRALNRAGFPVVVVTNQSAIARGLLTEPGLAELHKAMTARLAEGGAHIDAYYYCPHHSGGTVAEFAIACDCRKPGRALIDRAARDLDLDPACSFVVGDKWIDIGLARAVGAKGVLVRTGYGASEERRAPANMAADAIVDNLAAAVGWILRC